MRNFFLDKRGNFGAIFAIVSIPVIGAAGIAVDYARASNALSFAHAAGDAAILAGVQEAKRLYEDGTPIRQAESAGRAYAIEFFQTQVQVNDNGIYGWFTPVVRINNNTVSGSLGVDVQIQTTLSRILDRQSLPIESTSRAEIQLTQYVDLHIVIDTSASMGVGADDAAIGQLANATRSIGEPTGCAFACHVPDELRGDVDPALDTWDTAVAQNIPMRINVVKQAVDRILDDLDAAPSGNRLRVALHTFSNEVVTVSNPNPSIQNAKNRLATIELSDDLGAGGTDFHAVFDDLEGIIGTSGDGSSPSRPRKAVVFITDGLSTNASYSYGGHGGHSLSNPNYTPFLPTIGAPGSFAQIQGFDERICDDLKSRNNVTLATLNVSYVIPTQGIRPADTRFRKIDQILKDDIEAHMEACASAPELSKAAESPAEIQAAMSELLGNLQATTLRLTM
ncbi:MAG: pilus assembly protein TadG-related protein [Ahrensia sp.]